MPIYEYKCKKCGFTFEQLQKISEDPLRICPECKGELEKLISNTSFQLKGTGWYVTDFRGGGQPTSSSSSASSSSSSAKSSKSVDDVKSDPAPKKETKQASKNETDKKTSAQN